jgi:hypothetical protein
VRLQYTPDAATTVQVEENLYSWAKIRSSQEQAASSIEAGFRQALCAYRETMLIVPHVSTSLVKRVIGSCDKKLHQNVL